MWIEAKDDVMLLSAKKRQELPEADIAEGSPLESLEKSGCASTLISNYWPLELDRINFCYFKPSSLCVFVVTDLGN